MIKRILVIGAIILVGFIFFVSCHDDANEFCEYGFSKATVVYSGPPEVDGCGWLIVIDSVAYHPVDLSIDYQIADLPILLKYEYALVTDEFKCGRGGVTYPSIQIIEIKKNAVEVGILHEDDWDKYSMDPFHLDSAYVDNDNLMMKVSYGGGCRNHDFNLWKLPPNALVPPPVELALSHNANGDMCEAYLTRWLAFSLVPLRETGKHEITFLLRGSPEMSAYFGTYVYKY